MSEPSIPTIEVSQTSASGNGAGPRRLRLGGMALRNGLLIHGPTSWAAAARAGDGTIKVASGPKPTFAPRAAGGAAASRAAEARRGIRGDPAGATQASRGPAAVRGPAASSSPRSPRPSPATCCGAAARRRRRARASPRRSDCCRPWWLCAAPSSPPTTASSTRRSAPTSRGAPIPPRSPRSTSAAART